MSLRTIGPVPIGGADHGDPTFSWSGAPTASGQRAANIAGLLLWPQAQYLSELLANTERVQTIGAATGVLETLTFDDELLGLFSGWYILEEFSVSPAQTQSLQSTGGFVSFSLKCSFLGAQVEAVVVSSSRQLANDFDLTGVPTVVDPFATESADGTGAWLTVDAGGTTVLREYDPTSPMTSMGTKTDPLNALGSYGGYARSTY